jgi:hypothetical protein
MRAAADYFSGEGSPLMSQYGRAEGKTRGSPSARALIELK